MKDNDLSGCFLIGIAAIVLMTVAFAFSWVKASAQAAVWEREGIHLTTWEVLVGAKPAERNINLNVSK